MSNTKLCVICGLSFPSPPSAKTVTCSPECRKERARRARAGRTTLWSAESRQRLSERGVTDNLRKGTPAAQQSPIAGPYETNQNALEWTIRSPQGVTYTMRNLALWLRNNADLLDGTPEQARAGLMQIKRSIQGKLNRPVGSWKGWTLLEWRKIEDDG